MSQKEHRKYQKEIRALKEQIRDREEDVRRAQAVSHCHSAIVILSD